MCYNQAIVKENTSVRGFDSGAQEGNAVNNDSQNKDKNLRISDAAQELGLSVSTVSRAFAGKGRVSEETRRRVKEWARKNGWLPSAMSRTLQYGSSGNIAVVLPKDTNDELSPFFPHCVLGACEVAEAYGFDVIVIHIATNDPSRLAALIEKNKVDGYILTDRASNEVLDLLQKHSLPHVVLGSTPHKNTVCIDYDIKGACCEATELLIKNGLHHIAYIGGSGAYLVNKRRQQGFINAFKVQGVHYDERFIFTEIESMVQIEQVVQKMLDNGAQGVVTGDDVLCSRLMTVLHQLGVKVPDEMQVAALSHSFLMDIQAPQISCVKNDAKTLSIKGTRLLMEIMQGKEFQLQNTAEHEIAIRGSTRKALSNI